MRGEALFVAAALGVAVLGGCRQDMHDQPKYKPLVASAFFSDRRSARPIVEGTVARGHANLDTEFYKGKTEAGKPLESFPVRVTAQVLERGRERFDIYCSPCHDRTGTGRGMVVRRGFKQPPSFHADRLRQSPVGYFFEVVTNGFGTMPDYRAQIEPADRWAIIAYIRVLQRSQQATLADVPAEEAAKLAAGG
jgi:mono/diheme cytochrome c family protein